MTGDLSTCGNMDGIVQSVELGLSSFAKLERDIAVNKLKDNIAQFGEESIKKICHFVISTLSAKTQLPHSADHNHSATSSPSIGNGSCSSVTWESKHGALGAAQVLINDFNAAPCPSFFKDFLAQIESSAVDHLADNEVRLRLAAGEVLGSLCSKCGIGVYQRCAPTVISLIQDNLNRKMSDKDMAESDRLVEKLVGSHKSDPDGGQLAQKIFHESAGWRSLETSMKCMQLMIERCGKSIVSHISEDLIDLTFEALSHKNRFVRETGFYVCGAIAGCISDEPDKSNGDTVLTRSIDDIATHLSNGLSDNWSQVRLAASVATRTFLLSFPSNARDAYYERLLPPLCLNRYYLAEGVRLYNQETWRLITADESEGGPGLVSRHISAVVVYYIRSSEADNHAVREAACHTIAELASKVSQPCVSPFVPQLLDALLACFEDDSWPVRDAACIASGAFVSCFPDHVPQQLLTDRLYPLFWTNLADCIPSVRHGASEALAKVVKAYGERISSLVLPRLKDGLIAVESQPHETGAKFGDLDTGLTTFGVARSGRRTPPLPLVDTHIPTKASGKEAIDLDLEHTNQTMYSCGSLAPKMNKGGTAAGGGCSNCKFRRPPAPWEVTDGCVHLFTELCVIDKSLHGKLANMLPLVSSAMRHRNYAQHVALIESVAKCLPRIGRSLDKRYFKPMLDEFWDPLFYGLDCECQLTEVAVQQCLEELAKQLGPNIIRGRLKNNPE